MNILYRIYFFLPNFTRIGLLGKAINKALELFLVKIFNWFMPGYLLRTAAKAGYGLNQEPRDETYIVSLTSFPARIERIWITIETILRQNFKPDKIILWLAEEQFPDRKLPESLLKLQTRGLTIEFCDDLRSHKKYYYSILQNPLANIITFDDDLFYDNNAIKNLVCLYKRNPGCISANRAHKIAFTKSGEIRKYSKWKHNSSQALPSHLLMHTSGAGVLFPPNSLPDVAFEKKLIFSLSPNSDDVWLKCMAVLKNTKVVTSSKYNKDPIVVKNTQKESLVSYNTKKGGKDSQLKSGMDYFKIQLNDIKK